MILFDFLQRFMKICFNLFVAYISNVSCRLAQAEEQLAEQKAENARLRSAAPHGPPAAAAKGLSNDADLQDIKWRYQQLQVQYDYEVAKFAAQSESNKHSDVKLEVRQLISVVSTTSLLYFIISLLLFTNLYAGVSTEGAGTAALAGGAAV